MSRRGAAGGYVAGMWLLLACAGGDDAGTPADDTAAPTDDTGGATPPACVDPAALGVLSSFVATLDVIARLSPSMASASKAIGFYQLPGVDAARALEFNLAQPCASAHDLDPSCITDVCFWTECTGVGGSWIEHAEDVGAGDTVTDVDGWALDRGRLEIAWTEGVARLDVGWDVRALTSPEGVDYTLEGTAVMDGALDVDLTLPGLYPGGLGLGVTDSTQGALTGGGATLATWSGSAFVDAECAR